MTNLVYDGSWLGFLTAVFEAYEHKVRHAIIEKASSYTPLAFTSPREVLSDEAKALRVWRGLQKRFSSGVCDNIYRCFLSELEGIETILLKFIQLIFSIEGAEKAFSDPSVLKVSQVAKMVYREKHRMEAFVRFKLTSDDIYFAEISPDFNVLPLIASHFEKRYSDQRWLIYDLKRKYGIFYDLQSVTEIVFETGVAGHDKRSCNIFAEKEELYQVLWKDYFKHVNITERKNTRLHLQHVPKRYWKYLTEKSP